MRIALVYDTVYPDTKGGVEKRVSELAVRLAASGNAVHLLVPGSHGPLIDDDTDEVKLRPVSRPRGLYTSKGRRAVLPALAHAFGVWKLLRREDFDVVDCQTPAFPAAIAAWLSTRSRRTKLIITWHEAWGRDWIDEMGSLGHLGRLVEGFVARLPATHLAVSHQVASVVSMLGGREPNVIPPGVDHTRIGARPDTDDGFDVLFVGRLIPTKNLGLLIEATGRLVSSGVSLKVGVIGDGPARGDWVEQTRLMGLDSHVLFLGAVDEWTDVLALMQSARILALPSLREGYGMVALEAAACGVPVVTVDHRRNAARDVVEHGVTGLCVSPDPESFAGALRTLLEDDQMRIRLGRQARALAKQADWDVMSTTTQDIYAGMT